MEDKLSTLLFLCFGALEATTFHNDKVLLKPVPSVGARHGIEAYISIDSVEYYYDCIRHVLIQTREATVDEDGIFLNMCFRPELYMWRYENGACLADVYLDMGHILANMAACCNFLDIKCTSSNLPQQDLDLQKKVPLERFRFEL